MKHVEKMNSHASWSTTGQKVQSGNSVCSQLELATQSSREAKLPTSSVLKNLTESPRHFSKEHVELVKEKVLKLKRVGAIKKVFYPEWLANTIVVKKKSRKWWILLI